MGIKVFHQVGHFPSWNINAIENNACGDGLILSPVHQTAQSIGGMKQQTKQLSLFDPQYYLPNSPKRKLTSYDFFPETIAGGFSTVDFPLVALESAQRCLSFQLANDFLGVVIPARFVDQMRSDFFEGQEVFSVKPFLQAIGTAGTSKPIYLTLPLTSAMLLDATFRTAVLNWVTGFPELAGVYVLINDERRTKQIQSTQFITSLLSFFTELRNAKLEVIAGHLNTESILISLVSDVVVTFGSFENTRIFSLDKFIDSEEERRPPRARIYLPRLLNWIQFEQASQIRDADTNLWEEIYTPTEHSEGVFDSLVEPFFNQSPLYFHHFECMYEQLHRLGAMPLKERHASIRETILKAIEFNQRIADLPLDLDTHGRGDHLQPWLDSTNEYLRRHAR